MTTSFSLDKFLKFLELGADFYDGTKSSALAKTYFPGKGYNETITVADRFIDKPSRQASTANLGPGSRLTVFFRPDYIETKEKTSRLSGLKLSGLTNDNLAIVFHEGLHGFGNYVGKNLEYEDDDLQEKLGVDVGSASENISDLIKQNCLKDDD